VHQVENCASKEANATGVLRHVASRRFCRFANISLSLSSQKHTTDCYPSHTFICILLFLLYLLFSSKRRRRIESLRRLSTGIPLRMGLVHSRLIAGNCMSTWHKCLADITVVVAATVSVPVVVETEIVTGNFRVSNHCFTSVPLAKKESSRRWISLDDCSPKYLVVVKKIQMPHAALTIRIDRGIAICKRFSLALSRTVYHTKSSPTER
jgi:hypothetical protein